MPRNHLVEDPAPPSGPTPEARLVIHAAADPTAPALGSYFANPMAWLDWLRGLYTPTPASGALPALRLHIDNLQGQRVYSADDAGPRVELALPAGTYNVTAVLGCVCRGYTLTLVEGVPNDLYLCPTLCGGSPSAPKNKA